MMRLNQGSEITVANLATSSLTKPQKDFLFEATFEPAEACVVQVATRYVDPESNAPQSQPTPWLWPGLANCTTDGADGNPDFCGVFLEYGQQGVKRRMVCDARAMTIELPPCDSVRASLLSFTTGANWSNQIAVKGTCHPGKHSFGLGPTFTFAKTLAASGTVDFDTPPQVRFCDFWSATLNAACRVTSVSGRWTRNYSTGAFVPSWGQLDVPDDSTMTITNNGAVQALFVGRFVLQP